MRAAAVSFQMSVFADASDASGSIWCRAHDLVGAEDGDLGGKDVLCFTMLYFLPSILYIQQVAKGNLNPYDEHDGFAT